MRGKLFAPTVFLALVTLTLSVPNRAVADVSCIQVTSKVVRGKVTSQLKTVTRATRCRTGEVLAAAGPKGDTGLPGADGDLRIYGDGSAGAKSVATNGTLDDDINTMYTDFTVNSGITLTVSSGTVIRCTGRFLNNGIIEVSPAAAGGALFSTGSAEIPAQRSPHPGITPGEAGNGQSGPNGANEAGGQGGASISLAAARQLRFPGEAAGGGGGSAGADRGRTGGGSLVVLCRDTITNNGSITANGTELTSLSGGGGGGGVVILASATGITLSTGSTVSAQGGDGGNTKPPAAASGGGGGGIVHLLAPSVTTTSGTINISGGLGGTSAGGVNTTPRFAGGGGGGSGGEGGQGASLTAANFTSPAGGNGENGLSIVSELDPTPLF